MITIKLFTRFGALVKQETLAAIVVPEVIQWSTKHFIRDYQQLHDWQRYTEVQTHVIPDDKDAQP